jgi:hypothetical protein
MHCSNFLLLIVASVDKLLFWIYGGSMQINLNPGSELIQPCGFYRHKATYVGPIGPSGEDVFDAPKGGVGHLRFASDFVGEAPTFVGSLGPASLLEQRAVQNRARQILGKKNVLLNSNCEHMDTFIRDGVPRSPQVAAGVIITLGLFFAAMS